MKKKLPFAFSVKASAGDEPAEISIRGIIGQSFDPETWSMTDTETEVLNELAQIPAGKKINVRINSPGGNFGLALGCYNALASRYDDITTYNCGFACSAASMLMLAGKNRVSPISCNWMIHRGSGETYGNADDHQMALNALNSIDKTMAAVYCKATGVGTPEEWLEKMKAETWFTGQEACDAGLGTSAEGETESPDIEMSAEARKVFASFKKIPINLQPRFAVSAKAETLPPTTKQNPTEKSMKNVIAALVALGFPCAENATDETVAALVTQSVTGLKAERDGFKTQLEATATARKTRITAEVEQAATDKLIAEGRKAGLIATGSATAEGETTVLAMLGDLRAAKATHGPRGANPVPRNGNGDDTIESLQEELTEAMKSNPKAVAGIRAKISAKRGEAENEWEHLRPTLRPARN